ncbi:MAG: carbon-nitrogen hydrolase family protein [candidate division NC10 bacterium]|nr:carbon-nitrogen hydrolase family protein [candidate division NC10 bacterium]
MRVALVQMNSRDDREANVREASRLLEAAAAEGADLAALPELFTYLGPGSEHPRVAEPIPGPTTERLSALAARHRMFILGGSILERVPGESRFSNTSTLFDRAGSLIARYRKLHLFDVDLAGHAPYRESATMAPGGEVVTADTEFGRAGLSICYDLRFPELYRALAARGAEILFVPAAFTLHTGQDHWEVLPRARAIENQAYVVAPAQVGAHPPGRECYGNSLVADPWGSVIARAPNRVGVTLATLDLAYLKQVRLELPALAHRRRELLG